MKRPLTIVVDAGESDCDACEHCVTHRFHDDAESFCYRFNAVCDGTRLPECLAAERLAVRASRMPAEVARTIRGALCESRYAQEDADMTNADLDAALAWLDAIGGGQ